MKILIFSDSHGRQTNIKRAIALHPDAELVLFLGDGIGDLRCVEESNIKVHAVKGNCDIVITAQNEYPAQRVISVEDTSIFMCHGNRYGIDGGTAALLYAAMEADAQICLYGHTHVKHNEYLPDLGKQGLYLFNPGSISCPRDCTTPSYGILEIRRNGILLSHGFIQ